MYAYNCRKVKLDSQIKAFPFPYPIHFHLRQSAEDLEAAAGDVVEPVAGGVVEPVAGVVVVEPVAGVVVEPVADAGLVAAGSPQSVAPEMQPG